MKIFHNMNKYNIWTTESVISDVQEIQLEQEKLEKENNMVIAKMGVLQSS